MGGDDDDDEPAVENLTMDIRDKGSCIRPEFSLLPLGVFFLDGKL
jgi:hypothetical protein